MDSFRSPRKIQGVSSLRSEMKFTLKFLSLFRPTFNIQIEQGTLDAHAYNTKCKPRQIVFTAFWHSVLILVCPKTKNYDFQLKTSEIENITSRRIRDVNFFSLNFFHCGNVPYVVASKRSIFNILSNVDTYLLLMNEVNCGIT